MTAPQSSFLDRLSVSPAADGLVAVTVHLPPDLVQDYCRFLESLAAFFASADRKIKVQRAHQSTSTQEAQQEAGQRNRSEYRALLVASFDKYTAKGHDRKEAIKRVAADLPASKHPWCGVDLVRSELVAAGHRGRPGRPR